MGPQQNAPADESAIDHGQFVVEAGRAHLLDNLEQQTLPHAQVLDNAHQALITNLNSATAYGQAVIDDHRAQLNQYLSRELAGALTTAQDYGIDMPSPSVLASQMAGVFPSESQPGASPQPSITDSIAASHGPGLAPICHSELFPEDVAMFYVWLLQQTSEVEQIAGQHNIYATYREASYSPPSNPSGVGPTVWKPVHRFPTWWTANMACRLLMECGYTWEQLLPYVPAIEQIQITGPNGKPGGYPLCKLKLSDLLRGA